MSRFAGSFLQRVRKGASPATDGEAAPGAARQDPTELLRAHLRSGAFSGSDGLDDYDADFSASVPFVGSEADTVGNSAGDQGATPAQGQEAEPLSKERVPKAVGTSSPMSSETERAVPCEMIRSRGRTLIVGEEETALRERADSLNGELDCLLLLVQTGEESPRLGWSGGHACLFCPEARISGVFGAFRPTILYSGEMRDVVEMALGESRLFDLVLDLTQEGVFPSAFPPLGYYWVPQSEDLDRALTELPRMKGCFEKQHFIVHVPEKCAHGYAGMRGCSRCIEACPYGAIGEGRQVPSVDHLMCQGCLACASACPTGAIEPFLPGREELLSRLEEAIARCGSSGAAPVLLVHHEERDPAEALEHLRGYGPVASVPLQAPGLLGTECLLAALAMGAAGVVVPKEGPEGEVLESQVRWARTILRVLGRSPGRVQLAAPDSQFEPLPLSTPTASLKAEDFSIRDKRATLSRAVQQLGPDQAGSREVREMPPDACFGAVSLRGELCTLCMACAGACPTRALIPGGENEPGICFTESRCVQCGLCARVCPEQALSLFPRLSPERLGSQTPVWLHREEPEKCRVCGRPFASAGMLQRIRSLLRERRGEIEPEWLTMCGECRVRVLFEEPEDWP